ncbi:MAG: AAA family ATPase [Turneriella sp.]|nr:AAA family ATPase [Turneriella sp.]
MKGEAALPQLGFSEIRAELERVALELGLSNGAFEPTFERNEFTLRCALEEVDESLLLDTITIAKKHLENWRIHNADKNYLSLQALNDNIFSTEGVLDNIRIRIGAFYNEKTLEISRKGTLRPAELSLITALLRRAFSKPRVRDVLAELAAVGCGVYRPDDDMPEIAGFRRLREKLRETIVLPLKNPEVYERIARATRNNTVRNHPRAVLFAGPPGTGKTTMARFLGKEAGFPVVHVPLENILSAYYGESSRRLAWIFDLAQAAGFPLILFIDEIDALAPSRNEKLFEATRRLLSVLLRKLDGLGSLTTSVTIGATNRPQDLDAALLSRFESILEFSEPDEEDARELIAFYAKQLTAEENTELARQCAGLPVRAIRDICLRAERMLARQKIENPTSPLPDAPTLEDYLRSLADYRAHR